ncbi:hypothetical protein [Aestuariivirga sp.]|uniref:hypothetical protein n=1 Tax=Aestuariivirga sp. TaxID=2650926 RepID=UPI0035938561
MAITLIPSQSTQFEPADSGVSILLEGSLLNVSGSAIANFSSDDVTVTIGGTVLASGSAILLVRSTLTDDNNHISILESGLVVAEANVAALVEGNNGSILNRGQLLSYGTATADLRDGDNMSLVNYGFIANYNQSDFGQAVFLEYGVQNATIRNYGEIVSQRNGVGTVSTTGVSDTVLFENYGSVTSAGLAFKDADAATAVLNTGTISGHMELGGGADQLVNSGLIQGGVNLGLDADTLDSTDGTITGRLDGNGGDDQLNGGTKTDRMMGGGGDDTIDLGSGGDFYIAGNDEEVPSDGNDDLDGGDGIDTYDARGIASAVTVRLHEQRAVGSDIGHDVVLFFENVIGGSGNDRLVGDAGRNALRGNDGADTLNGLEGDDRIVGGTGTDTIVGNLGRDVMTGGSDADVFDFNSTADSAADESSRDLITDFETRIDDIDLFNIDANSTLGGNQAFTFIRAADFTNVAGQLRFANFGGSDYTVVEGDVNGDGMADFSIGLLGTIALVARDFVL